MRVHFHIVEDIVVGRVGRFSAQILVLSAVAPGERRLGPPGTALCQRHSIRSVGKDPHQLTARLVGCQSRRRANVAVGGTVNVNHNVYRPKEAVGPRHELLLVEGGDTPTRNAGVVLGRADAEDLSRSGRRGQLHHGPAESSLDLGDEDPVVPVEVPGGRPVEGAVGRDVRRDDADRVGRIDAVVLAVDAGGDEVGVDLGLLLGRALVHLAANAVHLGDPLFFLPLDAEAFGEGKVCILWHVGERVKREM